MRLMHPMGRYEKIGVLQLSEFNAHHKFGPRHRKVSVRDYFLKRDKILLEEPLARLVFLEGQPHELFPPEVLVPLWDNFPRLEAFEAHLNQAVHVPVVAQTDIQVPVVAQAAVQTPIRCMIIILQL
ncbi:unnamed protein product [Caenorhabditis brenneri]